jgi:hypothetical protein
MSHVSTIDVFVTELNELATAGKLLGMELVKQDHFKWFGTHVGDYPLPEGFTKEDMGKCEYVLRLKGNPNAYEVGIVKRRDGQPGYTLLWDFWQGGFGLEAAIGKDGGNLRREYALAVGMRKMARKGFRVERRINPATNKPQMRAWR